MDSKRDNEIKVTPIKIVEDKSRFHFDFLENRSYIYTVVFYICGLILGSFLYKRIASDEINNLIAVNNVNFYDTFINNFCIYFSIFMITVFLGFCAIGFPIVNVVPMVIGVVIGVKVAYYYINYSAKGIGYALIMIAPSAALLMCIISLTIKISTDLSKSIFASSVRNEKMSEDEFKTSLKKYLIYGVVVALTAVINAGLVSVFTPLISL